jgi:phage terminase small subunit
MLMPKTGYRPGAGRPRTKPRGPTKTSLPKVPKDITAAAKAAGLRPLEYMLAVLNDAAADETRRDRMAIAAAPYCHARVADKSWGKKDQQAEAAETAGTDTEWAGDLDFEGRAN